MKFSAIFFSCFVCFSLCCVTSQAQDGALRYLSLNESIEAEIKGGASHSYAVHIESGSTARVEIEQKGVDVYLTAFDTAGEKYIETDSPTGVLGKDLILVTARATGDYKMMVTPSDPSADVGKYSIKLAEIRPTTADDDLINDAAWKIRKLAAQAESLRGKSTRDERKQAADAYRQIIVLSAQKKDKVWEIVALAEMGVITDQLGELQKAIEMQERSLMLARELGNREHEGTALNNLGYTYKNLGDYEKAIFFLSQALDIQRETNDKRGEAIVLNNLGGGYLMNGQFEKAEELYLRSIILRRAVKDRRGEGTTLNNLGQVFARRDDHAKAVEYLDQALVIRRELKDKTGEAITLRNLAASYRALGDKVKAVEFYEQANTLAKQLGDRRVEADSAYGLAVAQQDQGDLDRAIETVERGLALTEQIRGELVNPELKVVYLASVSRYYELYIELLAARYERSGKEVDLALALQASEHARSRSLVELLKEARVNIKQGIDVKLLEQAQDLQDKLNLRYRQRTATLAGKPNPDALAKITGDINTLTTDLETVQVKIRRDNPRYADLTGGNTLAAKEIQALLDDDTILLEYKLGDKRSFMFSVSKTVIKIYTLPARTEIELIAKDLYGSLSAPDKTKAASGAELADKLGRMLLAPVAQQIRNKRLAIVADGILQFIPFASLSGVGTAGALVADTNQVVILPSASVLAELRTGSDAAKAPIKTIAIFADPVFEQGDPRLKTTAAAAVTATDADPRTELKRVSRDFDFGETLPRLLSSRTEARSVASFAAKDQVVSNMDFDASRQNVLDGELAGYRIVHFATHGLLDAAHPQFSGLVFSLFDKNGKPQDGFLTLNQIYNLNLNSDLVVLSACQTALGKDVRGEGLIGLTRGFMYAGARRVVASLWKVDDAATAEFMKRFYQNFLQKQQTAAVALRQTQIEMKQTPRYRSPYYWAGFTLQGDWK